MRRFRAMVCFVLLILLAVASATAEELEGRVTETAPGRVTLEVAGELLPQAGDAVSILTEVPGVGPQPIRGNWKVAQVTKEGVVAEPTAADSGEPKPGNAVVIQSAQPQRRHPVPFFDEINLNDPRSVSLLQRGCDQGQAQHCRGLGQVYQKGKGGVQSNVALAASFYRKSCTAELWEGCADLAAMYASGEGVAKNSSQAIDYFGVACSGGLTLPCAIIESYQAVPRQIGKVRRKSTNDFLKFVGLSHGDKAKRAYRLFGDPDHVTSLRSTQLNYHTPERPDFTVMYDQGNDRITSLFVSCRARPWISEKLGSRNLLDELCTHRSLVIARYGPSSSKVDDEISYSLPNRKGRVRIVCPDAHLNLCEWLTVHWSFDR